MDKRHDITDDPRLTAYALGELKGEEREEIEQILRAAAEARAEVEAIRRVAGALTYELAGELPRNGFERVARSEHGCDGRGIERRTSQSGSWPANETPTAPRGRQLRRRLTMAALATTAAGIAVALTIASQGGFGPSAQRQAQKDEAASTQPAEAGQKASPTTEQQKAADVQRQLAALVEQFNTLMDEQRFDAADAIVRQVEQLAPDEPVTRQMVWMGRFRRNLTIGDNTRDAKADGVEKALASVEEATVPIDDRVPSAFPKNWEALRNAANQPSVAPTQGAASTASSATAATPASRFPDAAGAYPTTPPAADPYSYYPETINRAITGAPTAAGVAVSGVAPASGPMVPQPAATSVASPCCAPASAARPDFQGTLGPTTEYGAGARAPTSQNYTIGKPAYATTTNSRTPTAVSRLAAVGGQARHVVVDGVPDAAEFDFEITPRSAPGNESYAPIVENDFLSPLKEPLSTFSVDVDTAAYANVRRFLEQGQLPPPDAVRIEEMLNYFSYDYAPPADGKPFAVHVEMAACPWNTKHRLARIAIKGKEVPRDKRPPSNLVFLVDVSGSMDEPNKLPLVKASLAMIVESLNENDRLAIVTYAGSVQRVLDSTPGNKRSQIMAAISQLTPGGSTNGEGGIQMAYETAVKNFRQGGTNRIILCTDGDFNVGVSDDGELVKLIEEKRKSGVFLSIFGFGMGNLKDAKLEKLADHGNGQYGYIDSRQEARKVFVEGLSGTLVTIAKDVKLQIEFNPAQVGAYRLVGYENRALAAEDFNNDAKDAGDIGAGHNVTALYEIVPVGELKTSVDSLKYQGQPAKAAADKAASDELFTLKLRYKQPDGDKSQKIEIPCQDRKDASAHPSRDFDWAAGVAAFGLLLRDSKYKGNATFDLALELAQGGKGRDAHGYRGECIELMRKAKGLKVGQKPVEPAPGPLGDYTVPADPFGQPVPAQVAPTAPYAPGSTRSGPMR